MVFCFPEIPIEKEKRKPLSSFFHVYPYEKRSRIARIARIGIRAEAFVLQNRKNKLLEEQTIRRTNY